MEFLTHINIVRVPQARQMKILKLVRIFLQKTSVSARDFLSLLGQLNAAADFVMLGRLHLRPLQISLHKLWQPQNFPLDHQIGLTTKILQHLKWWLQEDLYLHGIPMKIDPPSHTIFTDASLSGWGAHVERKEIANKIFQIMDFPSIDLFATRLNHRLPLYVSPIPDQKALSIDAISIDWNRIHAYAFPPFHLIQTVINKIRISQCKIVLIAPIDHGFQSS